MKGIVSFQSLLVNVNNRYSLFSEISIISPPQNLTVLPPTSFSEGPFSANCEIMRLTNSGMEQLVLCSLTIWIFWKAMQLAQETSPMPVA